MKKKREGKKKQKVRDVDRWREQSLNPGAFKITSVSRFMARCFSLPLTLSLGFVLFSSLLSLFLSQLCTAANWAVSLAYAVACPSAPHAPDRLLKAHYFEVLRGRSRNFSSPPADSSLVTTATLTLSRLPLLTLSLSPIFSSLRIFLSLRRLLGRFTPSSGHQHLSPPTDSSEQSIDMHMK